MLSAVACIRLAFEREGRMVRDTVTDCRALSEIHDLIKQCFGFVTPFISKYLSLAGEGHGWVSCALVSCRRLLCLERKRM